MLKFLGAQLPRLIKGGLLGLLLLSQVASAQVLSGGGSGGTGGTVSIDQTTPGTTNNTTSAPSSATAVALSPIVAANASNIVAKASPGNLYEVKASVGAAGYIFKFNSTTMPADGAVTAGTASGNYQDCTPVPANSTYSWGAEGVPESYTVGITIAFSSTGPDTFTHQNALILRARSK